MKNFLSREVKLWLKFKQLRRLQSLKHAVEAASPLPTAQAYRLELWRAILKAKGFASGFSAWYRHRPVQLQGSPPAWPCALPPRSVLCQLYEDFRINYRKFEQWNISQRVRVLDCRLEQSRDLLFKQLRAPAPDQVDTVTVHRTYSVLCDRA